MTGVRAGPGRIFATSSRRGGLPAAAAKGAIVVGEDERGELEDSVFSVSGTTPP